ncbi:MAG: formylglycine-generating enzyme family protein, partial [Hyphomicrobiaceae bacterium]
WISNNRNLDWLAHASGRLEAAEELRARPDLTGTLSDDDWAYLDACRADQDKRDARDAQMAASSRRLKYRSLIITAMVAFAILGSAMGVWLNRSFVKVQVGSLMAHLSFLDRANIKALTTDQERHLASGSAFSECSGCPRMMVVPAGDFMMGSNREREEQPVHKVTIGQPFAMSETEITIGQWRLCVSLGPCASRHADSMWVRGADAEKRDRRPVVNVSWYEAHDYVRWLAKLTRKPYRLPTEAEWEYAARAGTTTLYPWGNVAGMNKANCRGCLVNWLDDHQSTPAGTFPANRFGILDMAGNVAEWVQDCYLPGYFVAPRDGRAVVFNGAACQRRVVRGGSWDEGPDQIRSSARASYFADGSNGNLIGFRIVRSLDEPSGAVTAGPRAEAFPFQVETLKSRLWAQRLCAASAEDQAEGRCGP